LTRLTVNNVPPRARGSIAAPQRNASAAAWLAPDIEPVADTS